MNGEQGGQGDAGINGGLGFRAEEILSETEG